MQVFLAPCLQRAPVGGTTLESSCLPQVAPSKEPDSHFSARTHHGEVAHIGFGSARSFAQCLPCRPELCSRRPPWPLLGVNVRSYARVPCSFCSNVIRKAEPGYSWPPRFASP